MEMRDFSMEIANIEKCRDGLQAVSFGKKFAKIGTLVLIYYHVD